MPKMKKLLPTKAVDRICCFICSVYLYCASTSDARAVSSSFTLSGERTVTSAPKFIIHVRNTGLTNTFTRMSKCVSVMFENAVSKPNLSIMTFASLFSQRSVTVSSRPPYIPKVCFE